MEKIETKILNVLPIDWRQAKSEEEICDIVGCSHGSFYNAIKSLMAKNLAACIKEYRRKLYYRIGENDTESNESEKANGGYQVTNFEQPKKDKVAKVAAVKIGEEFAEKKKIKLPDYNEKTYEGLYESLQQFADIVTADNDKCGWVQYDNDKDCMLVCVNDDDGEALQRYDYKRYQKGIEIWRYRINQTYVKRGEKYLGR